MTNSLRIVRRNSAIQKDYFSMFEYLVWGVNQHLEMDYYKRRSAKSKKRIIAFVD
jgi:hypothetical protein